MIGCTGASPVQPHRTTSVSTACASPGEGSRGSGAPARAQCTLTVHTGGHRRCFTGGEGLVDRVHRREPSAASPYHTGGHRRCFTGWRVSRVCPRRKPGGTLTSHISWHRRCCTVWPVFVDQAHPERKLGCTLCLCDKSDDNGGHAGVHHVGISSIVISMLIDDI